MIGTDKNGKQRSEKGNQGSDRKTQDCIRDLDPNILQDLIEIQVHDRTVSRTLVNWGQNTDTDPRKLRGLDPEI